MQKLRLRWFSFRREFKKFHKNPTPHWLQTWSQIASIFFAGIAIWLTIMYARRKQEIQDMDKVVRELVNQNRLLVKQDSNQAFQIKQLTEISDRSLKMIISLDSIQKLFLYQNTTLRINTEPKMKLTGVFTFTKINDSTFTYACQVQNEGIRPAENLKVAVALVLMNHPKARCINLKENSPLAFRLNPNAPINFNDTLYLHGNYSSESLEHLYYKIKLTYNDPLNSFVKVDSFYYKHQVENFVIKNTIIVSAKETKAMNEYIKNYAMKKNE
jgi:hypothetical protein